jgi:NAD(P)-dependent dehydrogenase (short-subunit alcohol dehydrogenase family)
MTILDEYRLTGRTAIVTGASRGIGLAIARSLSEAGANVVLTSRSKESAEEAAAQIGADAMGFGAHSVDQEGAKRCVDATIERYGSLDILVNNAGTNPAFGPLVDVDYARFTKTMDVNLWAPIMWSGLAWRAWMSEHGGAIVNTASNGGMAVGPNLGVYHASKAALIHLTRHMAVELAPNVRVNAIAPGIVRTKMAEALWKDYESEVSEIVPLGRLGEPPDIGPAVAFLVSDAARWITGETLVVDGGQMLAFASAEASGAMTLVRS